LSELDNEDFRRFELTPRPAKTATKKRKLNSGIATKDDKQERNCNCFDDFPRGFFLRRVRGRHLFEGGSYVVGRDRSSMV
jgi:hypothetical protein